ncbi:MerR family transcriptional regulator [Geobacter anodireducens]|uniref:MerR family transcriptional regulator n=1 Tax=Geobacter anodireducens TaxID=1340425 RepID=A0ABR9NSG2_9BACT|nr:MULTISPECIES: MerR family transcriptional regulator [Geobacter]MBE2887190.1 MerR family transcriptional regulator [Geobacter anodireducens]HMN02995.1 MerR family transcriptional regulator [Geobacter anodireducens]
MAEETPDKQYYRIGEVSRITSLKPSVLRFWEAEFKELRPPKSRTGQRLYTRTDIELLLEIKRLLYGEKLTIDGARKRLATSKGHGQAGPPPRQDQALEEILHSVKCELELLKKQLQ